MANNKQRYINTKFWNDTYISELDPIEKLLFIYLLTNEHTNIAGVYEVPLKIIAIETGLDKSMLDKILPRLKEKVQYNNGYVIIKNFIKHQTTTSQNIETGILNCLKEIDRKLLESVVNKGFLELPQYYIDTLCIPYIEGRNYLDLDLDSNLDLDLHSKETLRGKKTTNQPEVVKIIDEFKVWNPSANRWYGNKTQRKACEDLIKSIGLEKTLYLVKEVLPKTNSMEYVTTITTPYQLIENYSKLESHLLKAKNKQQNDFKIL